MNKPQRYVCYSKGSMEMNLNGESISEEHHLSCLNKHMSKMDKLHSKMILPCQNFTGFLIYGGDSYNKIRVIIYFKCISYKLLQCSFFYGLGSILNLKVYSKVCQNALIHWVLDNKTILSIIVQ